MTPYRDFAEEVVKQWFKNHVAKFTEHPDGTKILEWRDKSGTSSYWFTAILRNGALMIYGDIGEAVYRWYPDVSGWDFFEDVNIDYFASKCCASETGGSYYAWDKQKVLDRMDARFREKADGDDAVFQDLWAKFLGADGDDAADSEQAWLAWYGARFDDGDFFDCDDGEWAPECGRVIATRCVAHLIGIKMALKQKEQP